MAKAVAECLRNKQARLQVQRPLIHSLTNFVVMNDCANMILTVGASPVMAHAPEEVAKMAAVSGAVILNIGTLTRSWVEAMVLAGQAANKAGVPVLLDPVGAGATRMRTEACLQILAAVKVAVIRANAAEAAVLAGLDAQVKGVDAVSGDAPAAARTLARRFNVVAAVTGPVDYVAAGEKTYVIKNGDVWMSRLTGTGCMCSSVVGCFCAVEPDYPVAAAAALAFYGVAGEVAAGKVALEPGGSSWPVPRGPLTFKTAFFDAAYNLTGERAAELARVERRDDV